MNTSITKRELRRALGETTDAALARFFDISTAAVAQWPEDRPIPERRALFAALKRPELFGALGPAANDDSLAAETGQG